MKYKLLYLTIALALILSAPVFSQQTDGYILSGWTDSYTHGVGDCDFLLYRIDAAGNKVWRKNFGGPGYEYGGYITEIEDGRFAFMGTSSGSFTADNDADVVVYRFDLEGNFAWRTNFGAGPASWGFNNDQGSFISRTGDGGYAVAGFTDIWAATPSILDSIFARLDSTGRVLWWYVHFGPKEPSLDLLTTMEQTADGGYISTCLSHDVETPYNNDFLVTKLDLNGDIDWQKTYGGSESDLSHIIRPTVDGGYIVAGSSSTYTHGDSDFLVYKLNAAGKKQWRKNYGGLLSESCRDLVLTGDGGYILAGTTSTYTHGESDMLVYKIDAVGRKQWRKNYGGALEEWTYSIKQTADGGYILLGGTVSYVHGDNSNWPLFPYDRDILVYKTDAAGRKQWRKNFGGVETDYCYGVAEIMQ